MIGKNLVHEKLVNCSYKMGAILLGERPSRQRTNNKMHQLPFNKKELSEAIFCIFYNKNL